jgi:hypothetical protein
MPGSGVRVSPQLLEGSPAQSNGVHIGRRFALEGDPKILVLRDGVEYPVWKKPVLDMIADDDLCPPGRLPGNSKYPTKVITRSKLEKDLQDWSIAKVIRKVERQPWLPIVESRVRTKQWRPWRGSPRSSDYRSIQERFDWDSTNVIVSRPSTEGDAD